MKGKGVMATKKFNCTFSVRETIERTYIITKLPINIPDEDTAEIEKRTIPALTIKDIASDVILYLLQENPSLLKERGTLIQTDHNFDFVKFIKTPKEVKEN